jgi:hypothetical protein
MALPTTSIWNMTRTLTLLRKVSLALLLGAATLQNGCLAAAAVGATGAVVGTAVGVTVGAGSLAVKGTGAVIDAAIPDSDAQKAKKQAKRDKKRK